MKYSTIPTYDLRALCIEHDWFTCGTNEQYEKLFYANTNGASMEEIATIIWICSDADLHTKNDILATLKTARAAWTKSLLQPCSPTQTERR